MKWSATPRLWGQLLLGAAGLVGSLISGRPEPLVLATPMLVVAAVGLVAAGPPVLVASLRLADDRTSEGEPTRLRVELSGTSGATVDVRLAVPAGLSIEPRDAIVRLPLVAGRADHEIDVRNDTWGAFDLGPVGARLVAPFGMLAAELQVPSPGRLRVYPTPQRLRRLLAARETALVPGAHISRAKGSGSEFAELRPYHPGDLVREVNWRATARRDPMLGNAVFVNERSVERSFDVVVLIDTFSPAELPRAVVVADALVRAFLAERDRVGMVSFGGAMRWIRPGMGLRQQYVLVDALLDSRPYASAVWRDLRQVPPHVLPSKAMVVAMSPLLDPRAVAGLADLDDRGIDLAVVAIEPVMPNPTTDRLAVLAERVRVLQWRSTVDRLRARGVPVAVHAPDQPVALAIEELTAWPRQRARAR